MFVWCLTGCTDLDALRVETSGEEREFTCAACPDNTDDLTGTGQSCSGERTFVRCKSD